MDMPTSDPSGAPPVAGPRPSAPHPRQGMPHLVRARPATGEDARRRSDLRRPGCDLTSLAKKPVDRGTTDVGQPLDLGLGDARLQRGGQDVRDVSEGLIGRLEALATLRTEPLKLAPKLGTLVGHSARSVNRLTNAVVVVNL